MEPAFNRGDLLFLWMDETPIRTGDIVVFDIKGKDIPIVHRILRVHVEYVRLPLEYCATRCLEPYRLAPARC
jgi:signal peptidase I